MSNAISKLKKLLQGAIKSTSEDFISDLIPTTEDKTEDSITPNNDGINHINTSLIGKTRFGRLLDIYSKGPFTLTDLGKFTSVAGFSYYITDPAGVDKSKYRTAAGSALKNYARHATLKRVNNYKKSIAYATYLKVIGNDEILEGMLNTDLPFRHYYITPAGVSNYTRYDSWYMDILEEIRRVVKLNATLNEAVVPNWDHLEEIVHNNY